MPLRIAFEIPAIPAPLVKSLRRAPAGGIADPGAGRAFGGGQFIPAALWEGEKETAKAALPSLLDDFEREMQYHREVYEQQALIRRLGPAAAALGIRAIPVSTVEARVKATIRNHYARAFLLGKRAAGNLFSATQEELAVLTTLRRDEYGYLRQFLADMEQGRGTMPYEQRARWYAAAAREVYWIGWTLGAARRDRWVEWVMGPTEHCQSCKQMSGTYRADRFAEIVRRTGFVPQSGRLDCRGYNCRCYLRETDAPPKAKEGQGDGEDGSGGKGG